LRCFDSEEDAANNNALAIFISSLVSISCLLIRFHHAKIMSLNNLLKFSQNVEYNDERSDQRCTADDIVYMYTVRSVNLESIPFASVSYKKYNFHY